MPYNTWQATNSLGSVFSTINRLQESGAVDAAALREILSRHALSTEILDAT